MMHFFRKNVRWIMLAVVVLFVISCFAGYGMYGGAGTASGGDRTVARVDGKRVMYSEIERDLGRVIQNAGSQGGSITSADYPAVRTNILDNLAVTAEMDKEVKKRGIKLSNEEIDVQIKNIKQSFPTNEMFLQQLQAAGLDERGLRTEIERGALRQKLIEQVTEGVSTDEKECRIFYESMKAFAFQRPEGFKINVAQFGTQESAEAARQAIEKGGAWDSVIKSGDTDLLQSSPYAEPIFVPSEQMKGDFAFLKDYPLNKISKVVKISDSEYTIAIKRSKEAAGTAPYEDVSSDIKQMMIGQKKDRAQSEYMSELRKRANVEVLDPELFASAVIDTAIEEDASGDIAEEDVVKDANGNVIAVEETAVVSGDGK
ncbi:peptidylprolyl isomerase [Synergistales bacterium]|nr:peptidylprolyl isomerase [Synergistales bacterium]